MSCPELIGLPHRCLVCDRATALHGICAGCYETGARLSAGPLAGPVDVCPPPVVWPDGWTERRALDITRLAQETGRFKQVEE